MTGQNALLPQQVVLLSRKARDVGSNSMKLRGSRFVPALVRTLGLVGWALTLTSSIAIVAHAQDSRCGPGQAGAIPNGLGSLPASLAPKPSGSGQVTHHVTGFYDDGSLEVAIAVEQVCARYIRYTVRLELPSGTKQSIAVTAPPGGLQAEVRDMTGDGIRNDLVITPALLPWPLTVLVNDGHDHFEVSNSSSDPGSLTTGDVARTAGEVHVAAALVSSGFHTGALAKGGRPFVPPQREALLIPLTQTARSRLNHSTSLGRDPPPLKIATVPIGI
jgi:hypothetical protein